MQQALVSKSLNKTTAVRSHAVPTGHTRFMVADSSKEASQSLIKPCKLERSLAFSGRIAFGVIGPE